MRAALSVRLSAMTDEHRHVRSTDNRKVEAIVEPRICSHSSFRSSAASPAAPMASVSRIHVALYNINFSIRPALLAGLVQQKSQLLSVPFLRPSMLIREDFSGGAASVPNVFRGSVRNGKPYAMQGLQLPTQSHATTDRSPTVFVVRLELYVLAMAMPRMRSFGNIGYRSSKVCPPGLHGSQDPSSA